MPTLIDELVVALSLDSRDFSKNSEVVTRNLDGISARVDRLKEMKIAALKLVDPDEIKDASKAISEFEKQLTGDLKHVRTAAESSFKGTDEAVKRTGNYFAGLRTEVIGLALALTGLKGVKDLLGATITGDAQIGRFAGNMGMSAKDVGIWSAAAQETGGGTQDAEQALGVMGHVLAQMKMGQRPDNSGILQRFGINQDTSKDESQMLRLVAKASQTMDPLVFNEMAGQLGLSQSMISVLGKGPKNLGDNWGKWGAYGEGVQKNTQAAQDLVKAFADLRMVVETALRPSIEGLATLIEKIVGPLNEKTLKNAAEMGDPSTWASVHKLTPAQLRAENAKRKADPNDPHGKGLWGGLMAMWNSSWISFDHAPAAPAHPAAVAIMNAVRNARHGAVALAGNNPGGINDGAFARSQPGYKGANGRYASFDTLAHGEAAQRALLAHYIARGIDTPLEIARVWAPDSDGNNSGRYASQIARQLGVGVNDRIPISALNRFQYAQAVAENGGYAHLKAGAAMRSLGQHRASHSTNIGTIVIHTDGKNAQQISREIHRALANRKLGVHVDGAYN